MRFSPPRLSVPVLAILILLPVFSWAQAKEPQRIFLIGIDGATWTFLKPLFEKKRTPHLRRCAKRGVSGRLKSIPDETSPSLWTSIATGKAAQKHGILDFLKTPDHFYSSQDRTAAALWNILSQYKKRSLWVRYPATHPAEAIEGAMVTERFATVRNQSVAPASLEGFLARSGLWLPLSGGETSKRVSKIVSFRWDRAKALYGDSPEEEKIHQIAQRIVDTQGGDEFFIRAAEALLAEGAYELSAIYLQGIDSMQHLFGRFSPYDPRPAAPAALRRAFGNSIERYYEYTDQLIGRLLRYADSRTLILIVSDHGAEPDLKIPEQDLYSAVLNGRQLWNHGSGPEGILIACGPGIRRGAVLENASVYDITSTLLYLEDLPVSQDMDGRILREILEPEMLRRRPPRSVETYSFQPSRGMTNDPLTPEERQSLKNIGYLE